ncbi:MAG: peptidase U32 [Spirochaetales bacterium]|nr:peptidase U32 [Spirochaetales bacterium]
MVLFSMRLTVPANYDLEILPQLKAAGAFEIYGKLPFDSVGGGRPSFMATRLSKKGLAAYIQAVHAAGMEFNYLLNAACFGNEEWTPRFHRQLEGLLAWLDEQKVDTLTITAPYLVQIVKKRWPRFKVKVGIYAQVDTVKRARYWEDLGADAINLESFSINRDFEKLSAIRQAVKADLVLIANHFCQPNCPYQIQHQNGHAHASVTNPKFYIDYPIIQCQKNRLTHKELFISAGWIRPEDTPRYEKIGYTTFKLLERNIPSYALVQRAQAYHDRRWEGNLADLLLSWGFQKPAPRFERWWWLKTFRFWKMPLGLSGSALKFLKNQGIFFSQEKNPIHIDSQKIPANFLDRFEKVSCLDQECDKCGYCRRIADQAVSIDPAFLQDILPVYQQLEGQLVGGQAWGLSPRGE